MTYWLCVADHRVQARDPVAPLLFGQIHRLIGQTLDGGDAAVIGAVPRHADGGG